MSFLNPVNEPVLRFKSTDTGAPQINYNARVAGDVKAVLKACLVTGYGTTASAGWTAVNEVANAIEFVSPSTAMSDYRLGIDDTSASSTTWYYQYQDVRENPSFNAPSKSFSGIQATNSQNGWQLLTTDRGVLLIEIIYQTLVSDTTCRITYFGALKSGLIETTKNIAFYNIGYGAAIADHYNFFRGGLAHYALSELSGFTLVGISPFTGGSYVYNVLNGISALDITSALYLQSNDTMVAALPGLLSKVVNGLSDLYGTADRTIDGRQYLKVSSGFSAGTTAEKQKRVRVFMVPLDFWEY